MACPPVSGCRVLDCAVSVDAIVDVTFIVNVTDRLDVSKVRLVFACVDDVEDVEGKIAMRTIGPVGVELWLGGDSWGCGTVAN